MLSTREIINYFDTLEAYEKFALEWAEVCCKEAMVIGTGDFTRPVLHACLKSKCVAYKDGRCVKYDNEVEKEME